jgi:hypothetical protein
MGFKFNPFTSNFDIAGGAAGGSDTQVQFNDSGAFAGDATFTFNKTTKDLSIGGQLLSKSANPNIILEASAINAANSGTLKFQSLGAAESCSLVFDASTNYFKMLYGTTEAFRIASSGQTQFNLGTAATPSISFNNDVGTGMYRSGTNEIGISANGFQKVKINTNGVGIGGLSADNEWAFATPSAVSYGESGWTTLNTSDYTRTSLKSLNGSGGGGLYADTKLFLLSGLNAIDTPDILIRAGYMTYGYNDGGYIAIVGDTSGQCSGIPTSITLTSGNSSTQPSGSVNIYSSAPPAYSGLDSGYVDVSTSYVDSASNSGNIGLTTGGTEYGTSGSIYITTGYSSYGYSGDTYIDTGYGSTVQGGVYINTGNTNSFLTVSGTEANFSCSIAANFSCYANFWSTAYFYADVEFQGGLKLPDYSALTNLYEGLIGYDFTNHYPVYFDGSNWVQV